MNIQLLPDDVIDRIAAGEVVERPASVLKELIENALDAGATDIRVEIADGGRELIRVADDGCGMDRVDAQACFQRHATSKIRSDEDLLSIATLGFRGEAIPSIASVSRMRVLTRPAADEAGTCVEVEGSVVATVEPTGCATGTQITVRSLFYNVPARRRFLRTAPTEGAHCTEAVIRQALIRPDVGFAMVQQGRSTVRAPRVESWRDRAADLLGPHALRLTPTVAEEASRTLHALVSPVGLHRRSSTGSSYHYVNGRFVRDPLLRRAVTEAYREVVPKGRHPVVVLDLRVPAEAVDVNVHPNKTEVRFRRPREVQAFVVRALRTAIRSALPPDQPLQRSSGARQMGLLPSAEPSPRAPAVAALPPASLIDSYAERPQPLVTDTLPAEDPAEAPPPVLDVAPVVVAPTPRVQEDGIAPRFLGLLHHAYWVCELPEGLGVIDPYVLRERVVRHALHAGIADGALPSQPLLLPAVVAFEARTLASVLAQVEALSALGCEIEAFDGPNLALKSVPDALHTFDADTLLRELGDACARTAVGVADLIGVLARHEASAMDVEVPAEEVEELLRASLEVGMGSTADPPSALATFDLDQLEAAFKAR